MQEAEEEVQSAEHLGNTSFCTQLCGERQHGGSAFDAVDTTQPTAGVEPDAGVVCG